MRQTTHEVLSSMPNLVICATLEFKNISLTCTSGVIYTIYQKIKQRMSYCEKLNLNESWYLRLRQSLGCMQVPLLISVCRWVYVKSNSVILYTSCACHACTVLFNKYTVIPGCHVIYVWILLLSNTLIWPHLLLGIYMSKEQLISRCFQKFILCTSLTTSTFFVSFFLPLLPF